MQGVKIAVRADEVLSGSHTFPHGKFYTYVQNFSEAYVDDAYIQTITFNNTLN
jgi:hypothetical protein